MLLRSPSLGAIPCRGSAASAQPCSHRASFPLQHGAEPGRSQSQQVGLSRRGRPCTCHMFLSPGNSPQRVPKAQEPWEAAEPTPA